MNDELLMRFIDGTATPKEVETVMEMLSKDDAAAKEWMQMAHAARLADSRPAFEVSEDKASEFVSDTLGKIRTKENARGKVMNLPWLLGGLMVAAAALTMFVVLPMFKNTSGQYEYVAAIPQDTSEIVVPVDSVNVESEKQKVSEYVAEVVDNKSEHRPEQMIEQPQSQESELIKSENHRSDVSTAAGMKACPSFRMVRPAKTPYRVRVKDVNKEFVFEWEAADAVLVELVISDSDGNVIIDEVIEDGICHCPIKAYEITDRGELVWNIKVSYKNGFRHVDSGEIEFVNL